MAFSAVTDAELTADKPIKPSLIQKFIDNVLGHDHRSGATQGAVLSSGSFAAGAVDEAAIADSTITSDKISLGHQVARTAQQVTSAGFFNSQGASYFVDPVLSVTFTPTRRSVYLVRFHGVSYMVVTSSGTSDLHMEIGLELDGVIQADTKVKVTQQDANGGYVFSPTLYMLIDTPSVAAHVIKPVYISANTVTGTKDLILLERQIILREFAK